MKNFEDVTEQNIIAFDTFLKKRNVTNYTKWHNYHEFLNSFIIEAVDAGYINRNPYKWVRINRGECSSGLDKCLTPEEFKRLVEAKMPTESLTRVRDLFVFQTYTCLRYSDLALFDASYIKEVDGMKTYIRNSRKTKKPFIIPLLPPVLEILDKYHSKLPIISNVKYNLYLKSVAQAAGLDIPLSTHWARHTGATLLLNEGVDMKIVSKICGHSSTRITEQIYAKLLDTTVVKAVRNIKKL
jgi:integrase